MTSQKAIEPAASRVNMISSVAYANWFSGVYQDPKNQIFSFAVSPMGGSREAFANFLATERTRLGALIKARGITIE